MHSLIRFVIILIHNLPFLMIFIHLSCFFQLVKAASKIIPLSDDQNPSNEDDAISHFIVYPTAGQFRLEINRGTKP